MECGEGGCKWTLTPLVIDFLYNKEHISKETFNNTCQANWITCSKSELASHTWIVFLCLEKNAIFFTDRVQSFTRQRCIIIMADILFAANIILLAVGAFKQMKRSFLVRIEHKTFAFLVKLFKRVLIPCSQVYPLADESLHFSNQSTCRPSMHGAIYQIRGTNLSAPHLIPIKKLRPYRIDLYPWPWYEKREDLDASELMS